MHNERAQVLNSLMVMAAAGNGYADTLVRDIRANQPSPEMLAARELLAEAVLKTVGREERMHMFAKGSNRVLFTDDCVGTAARVRAGQADKSEAISHVLNAIAVGRELADRNSVDRLTITIDGPIGSGKTRLGRTLMNFLGGRDYTSLRIIEIRDGRQFDVRADEFVGRN